MRIIIVIVLFYNIILSQENDLVITYPDSTKKHCINSGFVGIAIGPETIFSMVKLNLWHEFENLNFSKQSTAFYGINASTTFLFQSSYSIGIDIGYRYYGWRIINSLTFAEMSDAEMNASVMWSGAIAAHKKLSF
jgi:hypothetical protein